MAILGQHPFSAAINRKASNQEKGKEILDYRSTFLSHCNILQKYLHAKCEKIPYNL
ncbi:MAG: hypothetical protein ABIK68_03865 [bacterium]